MFGRISWSSNDMIGVKSYIGSFGTFENLQSTERPCEPAGGFLLHIHHRDLKDGSHSSSASFQQECIKNCFEINASDTLSKTNTLFKEEILHQIGSSSMFIPLFTGKPCNHLGCFAGFLNLSNRLAPEA